MTPSLRSLARHSISRLLGHRDDEGDKDNDKYENEKDFPSGDGNSANDSTTRDSKKEILAGNSVVEGLTLILPLIETALRIRFAVANECPNRLLTAECEG